MSFAAFIITYRRDESLRGMLTAVLGQSMPPEVVLVIDNASSAATRELVAEFAPRGGRYHDPGHNTGPAGAAAIALAELAERYDWIYWGDDDNPPQACHTFEHLLRLAAAEPAERVGAVAASGWLWDWERGDCLRLPDAMLHGTVAVDAVGGGAQLILAARAVLEVGLPNRELFWGYEDIEYCLRLRAAGYSILVDGDLLLQGRAGVGRLGVVMKPRLLPMPVRQAPWRDYYAIRNYVYLMKHQFGRGDLARRRAWREIGKAGVSWLRGPRYGFSYTSTALRAIVDGWRASLGVPVEPTTKGA